MLRVVGAGRGEPGRPGDVGGHARAGPVVDERTVSADLASMGVAEFERAYLNIWPDPATEGWKLFDQEHGSGRVAKAEPATWAAAGV